MVLFSRQIEIKACVWEPNEKCGRHQGPLLPFNNNMNIFRFHSKATQMISLNGGHVAFLHPRLLAICEFPSNSPPCLERKLVNGPLACHRKYSRLHASHRDGMRGAGEHVAITRNREVEIYRGNCNRQTNRHAGCRQVLCVPTTTTDCVLHPPTSLYQQQQPTLTIHE